MVLSKEHQEKLKKLVAAGKANDVSIQVGWGGGSTLPYTVAFSSYDLTQEEHGKLIKAIDEFSK